MAKNHEKLFNPLKFPRCPPVTCLEHFQKVVPFNTSQTSDEVVDKHKLTNDRSHFVHTTQTNASLFPLSQSNQLSLSPTRRALFKNDHCPPDMRSCIWSAHGSQGLWRQRKKHPLILWHKWGNPYALLPLPIYPNRDDVPTQIFHVVRSIQDQQHMNGKGNLRSITLKRQPAKSKREKLSPPWRVMLLTTLSCWWSTCSPGGPLLLISFPRDTTPRLNGWSSPTWGGLCF